MRNGMNHYKESDDVPPLSEQQAREQLQYSLRDQLGTLTFETKWYEDPRERGDGIVIAKINGEQVDHYIFEDNE